MLGQLNLGRLNMHARRAGGGVPANALTLNSIPLTLGGIILTLGS